MVVIWLVSFDLNHVYGGHRSHRNEYISSYIWTHWKKLNSTQAIAKSFVVTQKQKSNANNLKSEFKNLDNITYIKLNGFQIYFIFYILILGFWNQSFQLIKTFLNLNFSIQF